MFTKPHLWIKKALVTGLFYSCMPAMATTINPQDLLGIPLSESPTFSEDFPSARFDAFENNYQVRLDHGFYKFWQDDEVNIQQRISSVSVLAKNQFALSHNAQHTLNLNAYVKGYQDEQIFRVITDKNQFELHNSQHSPDYELEISWATEAAPITFELGGILKRENGIEKKLAFAELGQVWRFGVGEQIDHSDFQINALISSFDSPSWLSPYLKDTEQYHIIAKVKPTEVSQTYWMHELNFKGLNWQFQKTSDQQTHNARFVLGQWQFQAGYQLWETQHDGLFQFDDESAGKVDIVSKASQKQFGLDYLTKSNVRYGLALKQSSLKTTVNGYLNLNSQLKLEQSDYSGVSAFQSIFLKNIAVLYQNQFIDGLFNMEESSILGMIEWQDSNQNKWSFLPGLVKIELDGTLETSNFQQYEKQTLEISEITAASLVLRWQRTLGSGWSVAYEIGQLMPIEIKENKEDKTNNAGAEAPGRTVGNVSGKQNTTEFFSDWPSGHYQQFSVVFNF